MHFIKNEYRAAGQFFKQRLAVMTFIIAVVCIAFCAFGYWALMHSPDITEMLGKVVVDALEQKGIMDQTGAGLAVGLFANNFVALGLMVVLGFVPFVFLPAFTLLGNATVLSVAFALYGHFTDVPVWQMIVAGILPHGIFELPAMFIAGAMGIYLCTTLCKKIIHPRRKIYFGRELLCLLRVFVLIEIPLLIIASLVESFITPMLLNLVI